MARLQESNYTVKPKVKRPGVHSKNNTSTNKASKNYKKKYRGQGR
jgi:hypothetical protein